jgi:hypothetical protein
MTILQPMWELRIYQDDTQAVEITNGVHELGPFEIAENVMQPTTASITCFLSDPFLGRLTEGNYITLRGGNNNYVSLFRGYIKQISKDMQNQGTVVLDCVDSLYSLSKKHNLGNLHMDPGMGYEKVLDVFAGLGAIAPGKLGIFQEFGAHAVWFDGFGTTTGNGAGTVGGTVTTAISPGTHSVTFSGVEVGPGQSLTIATDTTSEERITVASSPKPTYNYAAATGTFTATFAGSHSSGVEYRMYVDKFKGEWDNVLANAQNVCNQMGILMRLDPDYTNKSHDMRVQIGPLGDESGFTARGGKKLLDYQTSHGMLPASATWPDIGQAQEDGLTVVTSAKRTDNLAQLTHLIFAIGHGKPEEGGRQNTNLHHIDPSPPADASLNPINGWALVPSPPAQAGKRKYFYKPHTKVTAYGNTYALCACLEQDTDLTTDANRGYTWAMGVINLTAATAMGEIFESFYHDASIKSPELLLSKILGMLDQNSKPIPTWEVSLAYALTQDGSNGVPVKEDGTSNLPHVGQRLDLQYQAYLPEAEDGDGNPQGPLTMAKFPTVDDPTDENGRSYTTQEINKMRRIVAVTHTYDGHTLTSDVTLGQGKLQQKHIMQQLARRMGGLEKHHHPDKHGWTKKGFAGHEALLSDSPAAVENKSLGVVTMNPGSTVEFDIQHPSAFGDHYELSFVIDLVSNPPANGQYLDVWLDKPVHSLKSPNPGGKCYPALRLALSNSGVTTGFFTTTDGTTWTPRGSTPRSAFLNEDLTLANPGEIRVLINRWGRNYSAHATFGESETGDLTHRECLIAKWEDRGGIVDQWGTIGWKVHEGDSPAVLFDVHLEHHKKKGKKRHSAPHHAKPHNLVFEVTGVSGGTATFTPHVLASDAKILDDENFVVRNEDNTDAAWTTSLSTFTGTLGQWVVYNAASRTINGVTSKSFGAVDYVKTGKPSWDHVHQLGQITGSNDGHTGKPWVDTMHHGAFQVAGRQIAKHAGGRAKMHPHNPQKYSLDGLRFYFTLTGDPAAMNWEHEDAALDAHLRTDDGDVIHTFAAGGASSVAAVPSSSTIVFNSSSSTIDVYDSDGVSNHRAIVGNSFDWVYPTTNLGTEEAIPLYKVGTVSQKVDSDSGRLTFKPWHTGLAQTQHDGIQDDAIARRKIKGGSAAGNSTSAGAVLSARATADSGRGATGDVQWTGSGGVTVTRSGAIITIDGSGAGGGMTNPMTTIDDIIVGASGGTPARLAKGTDGQVLTIDPTTHHVTWDTPAGGAAFTTKYGTVSLTGDNSTVSFSFTEWTAGTFATGPVVVVTPTTSGSVDYPFAVSSSSTGFTIVFSNAPSSPLVYYFNYIAVG